MAKKGENIRRRRDGRWEGRYIKGHRADGKTVWENVYGHSYKRDAKADEQHKEF